ncbi:AMP-binding protein [candidate division KSB1 bacterium]|nr:AMP-binding protein [candidate division KSB1 bacterium]
MLKQNFVKTLENSIKNNWSLPALSNYQEGYLSYEKVGEKIHLLHYIFKKSSIKQGDKIALIGKNSVNWAITYLATVSYGAVIVPILPDFNPEDVHHIINHSDSVIFFTSDQLYENLDETQMPDLEAIFSLDNFGLLYGKKKEYDNIFKNAQISHLQEYQSFSPAVIKFPEINNNRLAAIVYTSGTTGFSKGVMLSHNSLMANVKYAQDHMPLKAGNKILSFMPLAHSYGCAFEFLFPFTLGCHITFLSKTPSPKVIVKAFQDIKPHLILSVPLIIEKIYKKQIRPALNKGAAKRLKSIPVLKNIVHKKVYSKLIEVFGGNFYEIVIGGAALNKEVENFLKQIKFPFTIGYGMTECGPLISYTAWDNHRLEAVGLPVDTLDVKIDSNDQQNIVGEILVRGENVMDGYYKNQQATDNAIDQDGWLHTGDLGLVDKDGFVFIKGRSKDMILGPSGQNIYPEEIEARLNNMPFVQESLILDKNGSLMSLVYPDLEMMDTENVTETDLLKIMEDNRKQLNSQLPSYINIMKIEIYPKEFEKTPTKKIKRFLHTI